MAALRGVADDSSKDAAATEKQGGGKRGRDEGKAGEDGDQGKKARTAGKFPLKEPKVPVEIPTEKQDVVDPRVRSEPPKSKGGKKAKHTDDEKPTLDLPLRRDLNRDFRLLNRELPRRPRLLPLVAIVLTRASRG